MAISSAYSWNPTRAEIMRASFRLAGLISLDGTPTANEASAAADFMNASLKALQNRGIVLQHVERTTVSTTASTASYTAAADTLDVEFPAYVTSTTASAGTTHLEQMTRDEYMEITDKTTEGTPTRMYMEKSATAVTLILYPVPDSTISSFTYQRVRLIRDMDSGSVTADLAQHWIKWLTYDVGHDLALSAGLIGQAKYLRAIADKLAEEAQGSENEGGNAQFTIGWGGGWRA